MEYGIAAAKSVLELTKILNSSKQGITSKQARLIRSESGENRQINNETGSLEIFIRQLRSPFVYLLVVAAAIAWFLGEYSDTLMIVIFVVINTILGFYQEYKSEQTVKLLKKYLSLIVRVFRNGNIIEIPGEELVPGDVIMLEPGDIVPADIRVITAEQLAVDESLLTGESVEVTKTGNQLENVNNLTEASNIIFAGTTVVTGQATGIIFAIGKNTGVGKISKLTAESEGTGIFEEEIFKFSNFILKLVVATLVVIYIANLIIKGGHTNGFEYALFAVSLAVSVIPEALPLVATFSFSRGAAKLAKNKVIVKRLSSVEDLGSIEVLCSDKTGTLTENKMSVKNIWGDKNQVLKWSGMGMVYNEGKKNINPFNVAIAEVLPHREKVDIIQRIPFDPERRREAVLIKNESNYYLIVRGAPEPIFKFCNNSYKDNVELWMKTEGDLGHRVWAVAVKKIAKPVIDLGSEEKDMELIGVISFDDPIKSSSHDAIRQAQQLGVKIIILTGDKIEVSRAVALEIGLIKSHTEVINGEDWEKLTPDKRTEALKTIKVFCRVSPQQKYNIIKLLKENFQVGYLGDGINDAPALKLANVALAVKDASDIAREAADIVLLHKDLKVIIEGIKQGREIFSNTTKYIKATLAANFGNFYAVAVTSLLVNYLPMLPTQILLVNLLSDFPMIAIAADRVDAVELIKPKRFDIKEIIIIATVLGLVSTTFDFMTFAVFSRFGEQALQTNWFMESIFSELIFIFSIRTRFWFFRGTKPAGILIWLALIAAAVTVIIPQLPIGHEIFGFVTPGRTNLLIVIGLVGSYFATTEVVKRFYYREKPQIAVR